MIKTEIERIELRHLRYFVALVEERNFERAAHRLGIAQPALSQQVQNLEMICGVTLLDRSKRRVQLTIGGEVLFQEAQKVIRQTENALGALKKVERGESGTISVCYVMSASYAGVIYSALSSFKDKFPAIHFNLREMSLENQLKRISAGEQDIGFVRAPVEPPPGLELEVLVSEPLLAVVRHGHPLSRRKTIRVNELQNETLITIRQPAEVAFHYTTKAALLGAGVETKIEPIGGDFSEIGSLIGIGRGVCIMPKCFELIRMPGVQFIPFSDCDVTSDVSMIYRKNEPSPAVANLIAHCKTIYQRKLTRQL